MWASVGWAKVVFDIASNFFKTFSFRKMRLKYFLDNYSVTKQKLLQIYEDASNGIMRPHLAAIMIVEVCETALELFKTVEQQNVQIDNHRRDRASTYVPK
jgi:hypothetical protein